MRVKAYSGGNALMSCGEVERETAAFKVTANSYDFRNALLQGSVNGGLRVLKQIEVGVAVGKASWQSVT